MQPEPKTTILFIQSQPAAGADSVVHFEIMRYLNRGEFDVHVACTTGDGHGTPPSLARVRQIPDLHVRPTYFIPGISQRKPLDLLRGVGASLPFPIEFVRLVNYVRRHRVRVIHATEKPRDALHAVVLGKLTGAKSVVHVHVKWSEEYSRAAKWAVQNASAVFSISEYVTRTIIDMGRPAHEIHTILNCLDPTRWNPEIDGRKIRDEFGIAPETPLLACVSRLFSWKGQRELLRALALVKNEVPAIRLLIVGADEPYVHGGSFTQELKELARSLQIEDHVIFTGARSDVPEIMAACDVYAMPSFEEPFGIVFLEAMAMRRPVVALNNGGTPEVVDNGRAGLLSAPWDVQGLANNILKLIKDPALRQQMGEYGRQRLLDRFTPQRTAEDTAKAYREILHR